MAAAVSIVTGWAWAVTPSAVPAGLTAVTGAIRGGAEVTTLAGTAAKDGERIRTGPIFCFQSSVPSSLYLAEHPLPYVPASHT